jgi:hypothetical protein
VPALGWAQIVAYFGFVEFSGGFDDYKSGSYWKFEVKRYLSSLITIEKKYDDVTSGLR